MSLGRTSLNSSNYANSKNKKTQQKKQRINNLTAGEILTKKHNENQAMYMRKQISQQTQTKQSENQNYPLIIQKESVS